MPEGIKLRVWGDYACFTRPELKGERVTYDVMTPSAARGIVEAIYWKPEIRWVIDRIDVIRPIRFMNIRRNELGSKLSTRNVMTEMKSGMVSLHIIADDSKNRQQRAALVLRNVEYVVHAHFELANGETNAAKHIDSVRKRARKGRCFKQPFLGTREFTANFELLEGELPRPIDEDRDLGFMLLDIDFIPAAKKDPVAFPEGHRGDMVKARPLFWEAAMKGGTVIVPPKDSPEVYG